MKKFDMAMLMEEDRYWDIVEKSKSDTGGQQSQYNHLVDLLVQLSSHDIHQFDLRTEQLLHQAHKSELWCAATIMNRFFVSDDSFIYFKTWLISRGRDVYYQALADPDSLTGQINPKMRWYDFEQFRYAAADAFERVSGKDMLNYPYPQGFPFSESKYPDVSFEWQTGNPKDMRKVCPSLYDAFNQRKRSLRTNAKYRRR